MARVGPLMSLHSEPRSEAIEGAERNRTAARCLSTSYLYVLRSVLRCLNPRLGGLELTAVSAGVLVLVAVLAHGVT